MTIRVLLADDQALVRSGFRVLLERTAGIEVVGEVSNGAEALTTFEHDEYVFDALHAGASGFLLKDVEPEDLRDAVRVVAEGDALLSPSVTRR